MPRYAALAPRASRARLADEVERVSIRPMALVRRWKQRVAGLTVLGLVIVALVGILFFVIALAPCRLQLQPGSLVTYQIQSQRWPTDAAGARLGEAVSWQQQAQLLCISEMNEVALFSPAGAGERDEITLLRFEPDGSARRLDPAMRLLPDGKALGPFDFNLLPLPSGLDQTWRVGVTYAVLPPGRQHVEGQVVRVENGLRPIFELRLPTVEWIDERTGGSYVQIKDLTCRYRYDASLRIVDHAVLRFRLGLETERGAEYQAYRIEVNGSLSQHHSSGQALALRDLAMHTALAQRHLDDGRLQRARELLARLQQVEAQPSGPLAGLIERLNHDLGSRALDPRPSGWAVQVAAVGRSRQLQAEELVAELIADGFPAYLRHRGALLVVQIGPYPQRQDGIIEGLRRRFPREQPQWVPVEAAAP